MPRLYDSGYIEGSQLCRAPPTTLLDGYRKFLLEKELAPAAHQPYLVRWVREFLLFAQTHRGCTFEQTLDLFLAEVGARVGVKPWQLQQAANAARIYRYQYRRASKDEGSEGKKPPLPDEAAMLGVPAGIDPAARSSTARVPGDHTVQNDSHEYSLNNLKPPTTK